MRGSGSHTQCLRNGRRCGRAGRGGVSFAKVTAVDHACHHPAARVAVWHTVGGGGCGVALAQPLPAGHLPASRTDWYHNPTPPPCIIF